MKNKDIETRFEFQDNQLKFLIENQHDLYKRNHRLEERINKIEKKLEDQEITIQYNYDPHSLFRDKDYAKLEEAKEPHYVAIRCAGFSANKCPHCGSHDLFVKIYTGGRLRQKWTCNSCCRTFGGNDVAHDEKTAFQQIEDLKDELERARNRIKEQNSKIALIEDRNKKLSKEIEDLHYGNAKDRDELQRANDYISKLLGEIVVLKDRNKFLENQYSVDKLEDENKELKETNEVLNAAMNVVFDNFSLVETKRCDGGSIGSLEGRKFCCYVGLCDDELMKLKNGWKVMNCHKK